MMAKNIMDSRPPSKWIPTRYPSRALQWITRMFCFVTGDAYAVAGWFAYTPPILVFQALASRLQNGEDAIYLELPELAVKEQQQQAERDTAAVDAGSSSSSRVALLPPVVPLSQLEKEVGQVMLQAATMLKRLEGQ